MKNRHVSVSELTLVGFQIDTCRLLIRHFAVWGLLTKKGATTWRVKSEEFTTSCDVPRNTYNSLCEPYILCNLHYR